MSQSKYIIYIYKILSLEDNSKIFISSTVENLQTLLLFYIKNYSVKNNLYEWIKPLNKSKLKIKLIKCYWVLNKTEQENRENYWINKYIKCGFDVINNNNLNDSEIVEKIYVCLKGVSMTQLLNTFGNKIVSMSKEDFNIQPNIHSNIQPNIQPNIQSNIHSNIHSNIQPDIPSPLILVKHNVNIKSKNVNPVGEQGYFNELKNILLQRKTSNKSISEITNKKVKIKSDTPIVAPLLVFSNIIDELKSKMKKID